MDTLAIDFRYCSRQDYDDFIALVKKHYPIHFCNNIGNDRFPIYEMKTADNMWIMFAYHTMGGTDIAIQTFVLFPILSNNVFILGRGAENSPEKRIYSFPSTKEQLDIILNALWQNFHCRRSTLLSEDDEM